ncbi:hypothetical protein GCM10023189_33900 [Nibrella saemangeumensis]|uniref:DUF4926 domain-containing protein n=1 Tax=Nibrella saemangeumensis TaxID=1084526 RepID=A0ABP8N5D2_9BACT
MFYQYQTIKLTRDLYSVVTTGMKGVILEVWDAETFEVEFLDKKGYNYEFDGQFTFTVKSSYITECLMT